MKRNIVALLSTVALAAGLALTYTTSTQNAQAAGKAERHPAIHKAIESLQEAKAYLERANLIGATEGPRPALILRDQAVPPRLDRNRF